MNTKNGPNRVFYKAIGLLTHPITLISVAVLILNDWLLRIYWPSWWTGKMGDFAWAFFFPLLLAVIIAALLPNRIPYQDTIVICLAMVLTGLTLGLSNTVPSFHSRLNTTLEMTLGLPIQLKRDPSDLLALTSLFGVWKLWSIETDYSPSKKLPGWIVFQLGVIFTIANMSAADTGIDSLAIQEDQIIARSAYVDFSSADGGLTWNRIEGTEFSENEHSGSQETNIEYDYVPGEIIKVSRDGGITYPEQYSLTPAEEPLQFKYETRPGISVFQQGPLDAVVDPFSGNIIFAMGQEGILLLTNGGEWEWVAVGEYQRLSYNPSKEFYSFLIGEFLLSLGFGILAFNTLTIRFHQGPFRKVLIALGWILLLINGIVFPPALTIRQPIFYFLLPLIFYILNLLGILVFLLLGILDSIKIWDTSKTAVGVLLTIGITGIMIFVLPYVFWGFNIIPAYRTATILSFVIGSFSLITIYWSTFNYLNQLKNQVKEINSDK